MNEEQTGFLPAWRGALEGIDQGLAYGWAIHGTEPQARVVIELCHNGEPIATAIADAARTDLASLFGSACDACHGFVADIGPVPGYGVLTARVANTACLLDGSVALAAPHRPPASAANRVIGDGGLRLRGWAFDSTRPTKVQTVRAFEGERELGQARATLNDPGLRAWITGAHGFSFDLPAELADGRPHTVRVVDEQGVPLNGSPLTVCCVASGLRALLPPALGAATGPVIDEYERYLPRSLGMGQYAAWSAMFPPSLDKPASTLKLGLVATGSASGAALQLTAASVAAQAGVSATLFAPAGSATPDFAALLQAALAAGCDVIGCIRAGDELLPGALATALQAFDAPQSQLVYTDSEYAGQPWFKPAWNPDYALASDYPLELMLMRAGLAAACAAPDAASFGWQALGRLWQEAPGAILHVPHVLYRYGTAPDAAERAARMRAAAAVLQAHEPSASLLPAAATAPAVLFQPRSIQRRLDKRERALTVSLVIPTRDRADLLERCIGTIKQHTDWPALDIIIIDNGSTEEKTAAFFRKVKQQGVTVLPMPGPFNFAELNNRAIDAARGEIIGMVNNDIEALHPGWLDEMVGQLLRPGVGAVGAKLLWPNGMVQHGGILLGIGNAAGHFGNWLAEADWGDHGRNQVVQDVSGVTAACLFLRKADYLAVGGMDAAAFPVAFNDVDLCLKLRAAGKTIVWTPHARLLHAESASRGHEDTPQKRDRAARELHVLRQRWGAALLRDPAYHPSLGLDHGSPAFGALALPPRARDPRHAAVFQAATEAP